VMRIRHDHRRVCTFAYLNESGTAERYFASGLVFHGPGVSGFEDRRMNEDLRNLKVQMGIRLRGDFGWKQVPRKPEKYLGFYRGCIRWFFEQPALAFHCIVVDTHSYPLDSKTFFPGSKDAGIDAFTFHLVRCRLQMLSHRMSRVHLRFDRRSRPAHQPIQKLGARLRRTAASQLGSHGPRITIRSVQGGRHPLVHVCDLLLGCVTASLNEKTKQERKLGLISCLHNALGRAPGTHTHPATRKFNVWNFKSKDLRP